METIRRIENYTNANLLALNPEKSRIMIISHDREIKKNFEVKIGGKVLKHQTSLLVLGNLISDDLTWDRHVRTLVIPQLLNRARSLRQATIYMDKKFKRMYSTSIFMGKMRYAMDAWSGVRLTLMSKIQDIQDRVAKHTLGRDGERMSKSQRLKTLNWLSVRQEARMSTLRLTHKIIHQGIPEELSEKMPINKTNTRLSTAKKLATKPKWLNKNKQTTSSFRNRAYVINTLPHRLTEIQDSKKFSKWTKIYLNNPSNLPSLS